MFILYKHSIDMSTVQQGYLTPPQKSVSWPATGNVSGVVYSRAGNEYSRKTYNPLIAARQILAERNWKAKHIGEGYTRGGKRTRYRKSKSRKTRRRN